MKFGKLIKTNIKHMKILCKTSPNLKSLPEGPSHNQYHLNERVVNVCISFASWDVERRCVFYLEVR